VISFDQDICGLRGVWRRKKSVLKPAHGVANTFYNRRWNAVGRGAIGASWKVLRFLYLFSAQKIWCRPTFKPDCINDELVSLRFD
jgi:hypothetical protein